MLVEPLERDVRFASFSLATVTSAVSRSTLPAGYVR